MATAHETQTNRQNRQENVVLCDKKAAKGSVSIWVITEPKIRVKAGDLAKAEELLVDKIWDVCELDERLPSNTRKKASPSQRRKINYLDWFK